VCDDDPMRLHDDDHVFLHDDDDLHDDALHDDDVHHYVDGSYLPHDDDGHLDVLNDLHVDQNVSVQHGGRDQIANLKQVGMTTLQMNSFSCFPLVANDQPKVDVHFNQGLDFLDLFEIRQYADYQSLSRYLFSIPLLEHRCLEIRLYVDYQRIYRQLFSISLL
jgi:hypothetical protein